MQVRREPPKSWKKCLASKEGRRGADADEDEDELKPETTFVKNETQDVIEPNQVIESYKYGSELITVSG